MRNEVRKVGAPLGGHHIVSILRRQPRDHAVFNLRSASEWSTEGIVDAVLPVGHVPEPGFLRQKLERADYFNGEKSIGSMNVDSTFSTILPSASELF